MTQKQQKILYIAAILIFLAFCLAVGYYIGVPMIQLANEPEQFRKWVDSYGVAGRLVFVGMMVLQVIVALIPGEPLELAAGYAFGAWEGTFLTMLGILLGSWLVFLLVRRFGIPLVQVFFPERDLNRFSFLKDPRKAKLLAFILMTIPGTPKDLLSYFAGLTPLRSKQWLFIVAIARIPSVVTSTFFGAAVGDEKYIPAGVLLALTLAISGIGILAYRRICKRQQDMQ